MLRVVIVATIVVVVVVLLAEVIVGVFDLLLLLLFFLRVIVMAVSLSIDTVTTFSLNNYARVSKRDILKIMKTFALTGIIP